MLPSIPSLNPDMLLGLYRRAQTNPAQINPLSQLFQMNMQLNFLKQLLPNNLSISNPEADRTQLLKLLALLNQPMEPEIPELQSPHTRNIIKQTKILQGPKSESNKESSETLIQDSLLQKGISGLNEISGHSSTLIPGFGNFHEKTKALEENDDLEDKQKLGISSKSKKIKKANQCGHPERGHYAKNMCNQCYHKHGRTKKPWKCNHEKLYAHGLCQNCYINAYNQKRNQKLKSENQTSSRNSELNESEMDLLISTISTEEPLTVEDKVAFEAAEKLEAAQTKK